MLDIDLEDDDKNDLDLSFKSKDKQDGEGDEEKEAEDEFAANFPLAEGINHVKALLVERLLNPNNGMVNLKEFRDQLLGRRSVKPIVISWGMMNGGRLGVDESESDISESVDTVRDSSSEDDIGLDPKISSKLHSVFFWKKELIRDRDKERREKNNKFVFKKYRMINQIIIKVA